MFKPSAANKKAAMTGNRTPPSLLWFQPGDWVCLDGQEDWGIGQVQTVIGSRVTVNFENAGKQLLDVAHAMLKPAP